MRNLSHQPLFIAKLLAKKFPPQPPPPAHLALIEPWAASLKNGLRREKETSVRSQFLQHFFLQLLGYAPIGGISWTLHIEQSAASGSADAALGLFSKDQRQVLAPLELKGPACNLDALMPGRHKSPVQQAWEYAMDLPGSQFVLVSNCDEIRLYALGHGRQHYETWRVGELTQPAAYASFVGLLGAGNLLGGQTQALLRENALAEKDITQKLYADYKQLREQLIITLAQLNPGVGFAALLGHAQKLIDRVLFIAFAEDRQLLPEKSIERAAKHQDPYHPQPRWAIFKSLFAAVDRGNPYLKIPAYNGGLFAPDAALDALVVSDALCERFVLLADYDFASEVSVTVLGRLFEQSVADLEQLQAAGSIAAFTLQSATYTGASGQGKTSAKGVNSTLNSTTNSAAPASARAVSGRRKREGIVYTPDNITRFMTEHTLRPAIAARFAAVYQTFRNENDSEWRKLNKGEKTETPKNVLPESACEYHFWRAWAASLQTLRICDPACGSGAFLVAAFDLLAEAYAQVNLKLAELAPGELPWFDATQAILNGNLYGVDINAEAIEITKLSLWLKTAQQGKPLLSLEANLRQGNSLVSDASIEPLAFDWQAQFATVFDSSANAGHSGFDVILGNPPYVRQELFAPLKPYLQAHYSAFHGVADLYVYFYELGLRLLAPGGSLGFISSSTFFKTSSGQPLRRLLRRAAQLRTLVDFGDWQVFEGVTTYPVIVVLQKLPSVSAEIESPELASPVDASPGPAIPEQASLPAASHSVQFLQLRSEPADLLASFETDAQSLAAAQLGGADGSAEWQLESSEAAALRAQLCAGQPTLRQVCGAPYRGVLTGLNEAFVIDQAVHERLTLADSTCADLLKPFLRGEDLARWRIEGQTSWLILLPKGWTREHSGLQDEAAAWHWLAQRHPPLAAWLAPFAERARQRTDQGDFWWELRACAYYAAFEQPKIIYPDMAQGAKFFWDTQASFFGNTAYFLPTSEPWIAGLLNSKPVWFYLLGVSTALRGGEWRLRMFSQHIENIPIPLASPEQKNLIATLAQEAQNLAAQQQAAQNAFARRIHDLAPGGRSTPLSGKLSTWWRLADFDAFRAEVAQRFRQDIALRERADWQDLFTQQRQQVLQLGAQIAAVERSLNQEVYALFGLNRQQIRLIEQST